MNFLLELKVYVNYLIHAIIITADVYTLERKIYNKMNGMLSVALIRISFGE